MLIKPDVFLLIIISSGVFIITVGMIIVLVCPQNVFSCKTILKKLRKVCCCCKKKKDETWRKNIISYKDAKGYPISLVEGRPQGHGFYTAGPWSSTETTTTCVGNEIIYHINNLSDRCCSTATLESMDKTQTDTQSLNPTTIQSTTLAGQLICANCNGKGLITFGMIQSQVKMPDELEESDCDDNVTGLAATQCHDVSSSGFADADCNDMMACM